MKNLICVLLCLTTCFTVSELKAQFDPVQGCLVDINGECRPNVVLSAMPFLRITPDARAGGMGDVGVATSADPNAMHFNASKLAFADQNMSFAATYTPWLRALGLQDVYMAYLTGYKKIDELSTVGFAFRYFSLGEINFTSLQGLPQGTGRPRELEFGFAYARKLSEKLSTSLTAKYIYSNLASGQNIGGIDISSANAFAADLSVTYKSPVEMTAEGGDFTFGMAITNLGSKVTYTQNPTRDFLPTNLGIGAALDLDFDEYNSITFALDVNKLLIPSPQSPTFLDGSENPNYDSSPRDSIADYRQKSTFGALFSSFGDAQGGFGEEVKEYAVGLGFEYWYDKQFAVRLGYYYENELKGDRNFLTVGAGIKYNVFGIDISYLVPTNNRRNPLDNTLRFSLIFDFDDYNSSSY